MSQHHTLHIQGMSCGHCVRAVDSALREVSDVTVTSVTMGEAVVQFDPAAVSPKTVLDALDEEGYTATFAQTT